MTDNLPHSIEAEQQVLGAILIGNDLYDRVSDVLTPEHFYDPIHAEIFKVVVATILAGRKADPVTLKGAFGELLSDLGGPAYLVRLAGSAISSHAVRDYAMIVREHATRRELAQVGADICDAATDEAVAPADVLTDAEARLYGLAESGSRDSGAVSFLTAMTKALDNANEARTRGDGLAGLSTGLIDLDKTLGGMRDTNLIILAGRPSMGKTALATNIAYSLASKTDPKTGEVTCKPVGFFSLEMGEEQLAGRVLSSAANVSSHDVDTGAATDAQFRKYVEASIGLQGLPLYIDATPGLSIAQVAARARRMKRKFGIEFLVVDYLQLIRGTKNDGRVNEVSEVSMGLKGIAKELDIPVLALSQLSRQVENRDDKRPKLSDLRESGSIEQDADVVMFVYRDEYYAEREQPQDTDDTAAMADWLERMDRARGKAEVIVAKQRHGPIGTVSLSFEAQFTRFGNLAFHAQEQAQ